MPKQTSQVRIRPHAALLSFLIFLYMVQPVNAALENVPSGETAGAEQERFEKQEELEKKAKQFRKEVKAEAEEPVDEISEQPGKTFELKAVVFEGNETVSNEDLQKAVQGWIGKQVSFTDLKKIASELKSYYRDKRFVAAYVYLPPQKIEDGIIEIRVVEGRLGNIKIEDNKWFSDKVIRRNLSLKEGEVIYFQDLNDSLSSLNKNPDIKARALLAPGREPKTTDIVFKVKDKFPLHLNGEINNLGTESTGRTRYGVGLTHNNLTGNMDQLTSRVQLGSGATAVGTRYSVPVGPYKTQVGFSHSYSRVHLGGDFRDLNIRGKASSYGVDIVQPFWQNRFLKTSLNTGFDFKSVENKILGVKAGKDELRILNLGVNFEENDRFGKTYFPHTFHFGFPDFLGASDVRESAATRAGTGGQFFIYRNSMIRYNRLPMGLTHAARTELQLTPDRLSPSEQFRLGGAFSVRGYSEGDYLADYGGFITNEIFVPTYFFPAQWVLPYSGEQLRQAVQFVGFFDFGTGNLRNTLPGENRNKTLMGAGGGLRVHIYDRIFARFQWAGNLGDRAADGKNGAFYYGISAET